MGASFRIGTSGWQYRHWREVFYPRGLPTARWFDFFATHFDTVEVNNTFYRLPKLETWRRWGEMAPDGFSYAVKASRFLTHIKRFADTDEPLERFLTGVRELKTHLGPVLYQCPPNFSLNQENMSRLDQFLASLPSSMRNVVEFRHASWYTDETWELLRRHGVALCVHDMPGSRSPVCATAAFAYVRLHGGGDRANESRCSDEALQRWSEDIRGLGARGKEVWVYFNNDPHGWAIENATRLRELLS